MSPPPSLFSTVIDARFGQRFAQFHVVGRDTHQESVNTNRVDQLRNVDRRAGNDVDLAGLGTPAFAIGGDAVFVTPRSADRPRDDGATASTRRRDRPARR